MNKNNVDGSVTLLNGFAEYQKIAHTFFEDGYRYTSLYLQGAYSFFYDITTIPSILNFVKFCCGLRTVSFLKKIIIKNNITDVVSFHFAVTPSASKACKKIFLETGKKIPVTQVITDPFTAHPAWYLVPNAKFVVFSKQIKEKIIKEKLIDENAKIENFDFIIGNKFYPPSKDEIFELKTKHFSNFSNYDFTKKTILVVGGGDGLKGMYKLVKEFCSIKDFNFIVICGKVKKRLEKVNKIIKKNNSKNIFVYDYVNFISDFIKISDCVITKAGANIMMEVLACKKPIIVSNYIHGQEKGNVEHIIKSRAGWFIQSPKKIIQKILSLKNVEDIITEKFEKRDYERLIKFIVDR
ncbi:MAG: glycosyltransferase [Treponema sp.]|nr:glycosyltransferase [Treponema sp.]